MAAWRAGACGRLRATYCLKSASPRIANAAKGGARLFSRMPPQPYAANAGWELP
jgi:hypothetical protein